MDGKQDREIELRIVYFGKHFDFRIFNGFRHRVGRFQIYLEIQGGRAGRNSKSAIRSGRKNIFIYRFADFNCTCGNFFLFARYLQRSD